MGAWGCGMQANDTALDFIYEVQKARIKDKAKTFRKVVKKLKHDRWGTRSKAVLGMAEWMLDHDHSLKGLMTEIKRCLKAENSKRLIFTWRDPEERKDALDRFQKRLDGKKVDEKDLALDNMGLLDRIATTGMSKEEVKDLL